jgi:putative ABC transport system permease protein
MTVNSFAEYAFRSTLKVYNNYNFNVGVTSNQDVLEEISTFDYIDKYSIANTVYLNIYVDENQLNNKIVELMNDFNYIPELQKYQLSIQLSTLGDKEFTRYLKENNLDVNDYKDLSNPKIVMIDKSNFFVSNKYYQLALTNLKEGDKITLKSNEKTVQEVAIGSIVSDYPIGFNNTDSRSQTILGFISDEVYNSIINNIDDNLSGESAMMYIQSSNPSKLVKQIETLGKAKGIEINAMNIDEQVKMLRNIVLAIEIFLYGFITLVSLITVTNVINTIATNIYLRRREFAMIKAIGMTDKDFKKMIRFESLFYGLKSLLYGLPLGILIDYFMFRNAGSLFVYDYELPFKPILICVVFVFVIISITMTYATKKIKNDNIIDVIKQENF